MGNRRAQTRATVSARPRRVQQLVTPYTTTQPSAEAHLDTHVLVWLYADPKRVWPPKVLRLLETAPLRYAPMARLELQYLHEIGRLKVSPDVLLNALHEPLGLRECQQPFSQVVTHAQTLKWTRDVFDRMIVAQAMAAQASLISADATIAQHFDGSIWDA